MVGCLVWRYPKLTNNCCNVKTFFETHSSNKTFAPPSCDSEHAEPACLQWYPLFTSMFLIYFVHVRRAFEKMPSLSTLCFSVGTLWVEVDATFNSPHMLWWFGRPWKYETSYTHWSLWQLNFQKIFETPPLKLTWNPTSLALIDDFPSPGVIFRLEVASIQHILTSVIATK